MANSILIAVPTFENIMPETFRSIYNLKIPNEHTVSFDFVKGYDCAKARNEIAKKALNEKFDYILYVDSDMILPSDTLIRLREFDNSDIVFGLYPRKNTTSKEIECFKIGERDYTNRFHYDELGTEERIVVKGAGFGCALVNTSVFYKITYPYFKYVSYEDGTVLSEDLYFCSQARNAGYTLQADTRVKCGHCMKYFKYE